MLIQSPPAAQRGVCHAHGLALPAEAVPCYFDLKTTDIPRLCSSALDAAASGCALNPSQAQHGSLHQCISGTNYSLHGADTACRKLLSAHAVQCAGTAHRSGRTWGAGPGRSRPAGPRAHAPAPPCSGPAPTPRLRAAAQHAFHTSLCHMDISCDMLCRITWDGHAAASMMCAIGHHAHHPVPNQ